MLMMFGPALRKAPFERAMPLNQKDLMILMSPEIGFRLCNVTTEGGLTFEIKDFMTSSKETFGDIDFNQRMLDFADIFQGRVERFFTTKKSDYIFFDQEEQKFIRKLMSKPGITCSVEIYRYYKDKSPERIDFLDIEYQEGMKVTRFLNSCGVKMILTARDFYYLAKPSHEDSRGRKSKYQEYKKEKSENEMSCFFARYSKLKDLTTKELVNKYFKKLTIKYHPDRNIAQGGEDTTDICATITGDHESIKATAWYNKLPDNDAGGGQ